MEWTVPGAALRIPLEEADTVPQTLSSLFLAGGMTLGQLASITGLEAHAIQNWVKRGFLSPPKNKRYTLNQLCRILNINMLRAVLSLEQICSLLGYINGDLQDESDDLIDDARLYFLFVRLAAYVSRDAQNSEALLRQLLAGYTEPAPGTRERVEKVLRIMLTAWTASQMRQQAEAMLQELNEKEKCKQWK